MKISVKKEDFKKINVGSLVFFVFEKEKYPEINILDKFLGGIITNIIKGKEFKGSLAETLLIHTAGKLAAPHVLLVGLGKKEEFGLNTLRKGMAKAALYLRELNQKSFALVFRDFKLDYFDAAQALTEGAYLSLYKFDRYKSKKEDDSEKRIEEIVFISEKNKEKLEKGIRQGQIISSATILTRNLVNTPSLDLNPIVFAKKAKEVAVNNKLKCTVYDEKQLHKLGMNALFGVGSGSANPPRFVVVEYNSNKKNLDTIVLVGKGITFDSGGIDLKPMGYIEDMKKDKGGASAVLGIMQAVAQLKLPLRVVGLMPLAENMPSGSAIRPGDVLKAYNGKTIEVLNTDAEGRLILADALSFATKFKAKAIIDMATLTGSAIIALGQEVSAIMGTDQKLIDKIKKAGEFTYDKVWQLPLYKEYCDHIKSDIADMKNLGHPKGYAGAITAAALLKEFVGEIPWAHLDIAGTAYLEKDSYYLRKGATGSGVRLLVKFLQDWR